MKANELQIGDYAACEGKNGKVKELREGKLSLKTENSVIIVYYNNVEPIPITPEILEKNEFWYQDNVGYVMEEYEYEIIYNLWDHKLRILKNREQILNLEYFDEMCIHELQHALCLCEINKEIKL